MNQVSRRLFVSVDVPLRMRSPIDQEAAMRKITLFCLHGLGLSGSLWQRVASALGTGFECVLLDLPGFGDSRSNTATTIDETSEWVIKQIGKRSPDQWLLVGHSMGGKIASVVAARAEQGSSGLTLPLGIVLVAASPASPEPMHEGVRLKMIDWASGGEIGPAQADEFIASNTARPLPDETLAMLQTDLLRTSADAWTAWLERGSREDWSAFVGSIETRALIIAGGEDGPLGEACQRDITASFFRQHRFVLVTEAAHLIPVEQPLVLAEHIREFAEAMALARMMTPEFARLLASDRVSVRTRTALTTRLTTPVPVAPVFGREQHDALRALVDRLLPQTDQRIDLVAAIETSLAAGEGDGWRLAELPTDVDAWRGGIDTLMAAQPGFAALNSAAQDAWIAAVIAGDGDQSLAAGPLDIAQMKLWIEEVRRATVRAWLAHPAGLSAIGYDGFANGGDGIRMQGFQNVKANHPDPWQAVLSPLENRR